MMMTTKEQLEEGEVSAHLTVNTGDIVRGETVTYEGNATSTLGQIVKMELINSDEYVLLHHPGAEPLIHELPMLSTGSYSVCLRATDDQDNVGFSEWTEVLVRAKDSDEDKISIIHPEPDREYEISEGVDLCPAVSITPNPLANIRYVTYYEGDMRIGYAENAPFGIQWFPDKPGIKRIKAVAQIFLTNDEGDNYTIEGEIAFKITGVRLTSPIPEAVYRPNNLVLVSAEVEVPETEVVQKVEFYNGLEKIGESMKIPFETNWNAPGVGTYNLKAVAILRDERTIESPERSIHVEEEPGIRMTSPKPSTVIAAPVSVHIEAIASLDSVTHVRIIGEPIRPAGPAKELRRIDNPTFPITWSWEDPALGVYDVWAIAYLSDGGGELRTDKIRFRVSPVGSLLNGLHFGNSITRHGITSFWWGSWGMAASNREKDYVHQLESLIKATNPTYSGSPQGHKGWETAHVNFDYSAFDTILTLEVDLVTIMLGDNTQDTTGFENSCFEFLTYIRNRLPSATIICTDNWYYNQVKADAWRLAAERVPNVKFVSIRDIKNASTEAGMGTPVMGDDGTWHAIDHSGVATHPGDAGMEAIAQRLFQAIGD